MTSLPSALSRAARRGDGEGGGGLDAPRASGNSNGHGGFLQRKTGQGSCDILADAPWKLDPSELVSSYQPAGDQPQAIARLTEGLESGLAHQTLLGVTGSGKSIGYDDPLYIIERTADGRRTRLVPAGPFIDSLMAASELATTEEAETERFACAGRSFFTLAYDPSTGETREYPVAAFLRHRAPARMFRLSTQCGRAVVLTGDHNLWVLRDGQLRLVRTEHTRATDFLPTPETTASAEDLACSGDLRELAILPYLADSNLSVFAETPILEFVAAVGSNRFVTTMRACSVNPYSKLSRHPQPSPRQRNPHQALPGIVASDEQSGWRCSQRRNIALAASDNHAG